MKSGKLLTIEKPAKLAIALSVTIGLGVSTSPLFAEKNNQQVTGELEVRGQPSVTEREFVSEGDGIETASSAASRQILIEGAPVLTSHKVGDRLMVSINPYEFRGDTSSSNDSLFYSFSDLMLWLTGGACLQAPVNLPHGATVTAVWATMFDNDANDWTFYLARADTGPFAPSSPSELMATVTTTGASTDLQNPGDDTIDFPLIDNYNYNYSIFSCASPAVGWNFAMSDIRIYYSVN